MLLTELYEYWTYLLLTVLRPVKGVNITAFPHHLLLVEQITVSLLIYLLGYLNIAEILSR